jgi:hypothetical protein
MPRCRRSELCFMHTAEHVLQPELCQDELSESRAAGGSPGSRQCDEFQFSNPTETGMVISFNYPFTFYLPFTSVNLTQVNIFTQVQMRQEQ